MTHLDIKITGYPRDFNVCFKRNCVNTCAHHSDLPESRFCLCKKRIVLFCSQTVDLRFSRSDSSRQLCSATIQFAFPSYIAAVLSEIRPFFRTCFQADVTDGSAWLLELLYSAFRVSCLSNPGLSACSSCLSSETNSTVFARLQEMAEWEKATRVTKLRDHVYGVDVSPKWTVGSTPFGGSFKLPRLSDGLSPICQATSSACCFEHLKLNPHRANR